jgi:hypothetical protein
MKFAGRNLWSKPELGWPSLAVLGLCAVAAAQSQPVEHQAKGPADKDIQIGTYINVKPDCTSGPLPTIRLIGPPEHGKVRVKKVNVNATNYKQCLALEVPGYVAFYRAASGFAGTDVVTLEVRFPGGRSELQKITVTVTGFGLGL